MNQQEALFIENITVPAQRARGLNTEAVDRLAESVKRIGLQTPITVRYDDASGDVILVAGLHRLEAARRLGWETIPAIYTDGTPDEARMWEIAENLHRADLSQLERDEHVAEWIALAERISAQVAPKMDRGRPEAGINKAARELGVDRTDAQRAVKVAGLAPEAKEAARDAGLADNRTALLQAAKEPPERQAEALRNYRPAPAVVHEFESYEAALRAVVRIVNRIPQDWRDRIRDEVFDAPVFDRTSAA